MIIFANDLEKCLNNIDIIQDHKLEFVENI